LIPLMMDYITNRVVQIISQEIKDNHKHLIYLIKLFQPQASGEIKAEQVSLILEPIVENLRGKFPSPKKLNTHLENMRSEMRSHITKLLGYGEVNISYLKKVAILINPKIQLIANSQYTKPIVENRG
ncbi:MAG: hypothetical protein WBV73_22390, partial [Phormidium sp.]